MQHDPRRALAGQALVAAERAGLKVWQHLGAAYVARRVRDRLLPAPKHWQRLIVSLSFEIAELLDFDCGWGCTVERLPGGKCLVYRPQRWAISRDTSATFDALDTVPVASEVTGRAVVVDNGKRSG
jgi:hypothetical protein